MVLRTTRQRSHTTTTATKTTTTTTTATSNNNENSNSNSNSNSSSVHVTTTTTLEEYQKKQLGRLLRFITTPRNYRPKKKKESIVVTTATALAVAKAVVVTAVDDKSPNYEVVSERVEDLKKSDESPHDPVVIAVTEQEVNEDDDTADIQEQEQEQHDLDSLSLLEDVELLSVSNSSSHLNHHNNCHFRACGGELAFLDNLMCATYHYSSSKPIEVTPAAAVVVTPRTPTVTTHAKHEQHPQEQQSIECIFASQIIQDDKRLWKQLRNGEMIAPSVLQQSLLKNRSMVKMLSYQKRQQQQQSLSLSQREPPPGVVRIITPKNLLDMESLLEDERTCHQPEQPEEEQIPGRVSLSTSTSSSSSSSTSTSNVVSSSFATPKNENATETTTLQLLPSPPQECICQRQHRPALTPDQWPQRPLLLRPGKGTRVIGIRFAQSKEYLWKASTSSTTTSSTTTTTVLTWPNELKKHWNRTSVSSNNDNNDNNNNNNTKNIPMCPLCMILPINNGNEEKDTLVTDFETDLFKGTLLLRIRYSHGTTPKPYDDTKGYFYDVQRKYQAVIQGQFKEAIPFTECQTGLKLERPCGKIPSKWILKGGLNVLSFFAPQLECHLDGPHPSSLTPLGSTPQSLIVDDDDDDVPTTNIDQALEEPTTPARTLLNKASSSTSPTQRGRSRKKAFDKLYAQKSQTPLTDPSKVYTFEFLQHLFNFEDFCFELGLGPIHMKTILDGQPTQIMACHGERRLWAFDLWHEKLYEDALRHDTKSK